MSSRQERFRATALIHLDALYRFARRLASGNGAVAEDLVQEALLQAWRSFDHFDPGTNCRAWLHRILFHVHSHERRRRQQEPIEFDSDSLDQLTAMEVSPAPQQFTSADVVAAFDKLPRAHQVVVFLADVQELSYREISAVLGIPIGTVMSRLSRGRSLLGTYLTAQSRGLRLVSRRS
jgi:RNA polymerase sigma-70 factor, ECF subfamily